MMTHELHVAGLVRHLPLCPISPTLYIGAFVMFGDTELTEACAAALLERAPEDFDVMITAESKGIPLICAMSRQKGQNRYVLARKSVKLYMKDVVQFEVQSITTAARQTLYLDGADAEYLKGKRVLIVDDVISTGASLEALEHIVTESGGEVVGRMAVLAEGDAIPRTDITYLSPLPLFAPDGTPLA
ncbi:MAG: adenine phosphoribosyltransferase [Clostridia bacterium]|nr:adenine phosphoribosyltransferase [Clostridia bacterium]